MNVTTFTEVRQSVGFNIVPARHFYFHGLGYAPRSGKWAKVISGAMTGTVKVTVLSTGNVSLRSVGPDGNGRLVHLSGTATVTIDGEDYTLTDFIARQTSRVMLDRLLASLGL